MRHLYLLAAAAAGQPTRIWIDADCDGFHDAAAIRQLSKHNIIGASAVFGSTTVIEAQRKCADVLRKAVGDGWQLERLQLEGLHRRQLRLSCGHHFSLLLCHCFLYSFLLFFHLSLKFLLF